MPTTTTTSSAIAAATLPVGYYDVLARWGLKVIVPATIEPVTLGQAKLHLRITDDAGSPSVHPDDPLITALITAARQYCEAYSGLALASQVVELGGRSFMPASAYLYSGSSGQNTYCTQYVELPMPPIAGIQSVSYADSTGTQIPIAASGYILDDYVFPPRLYSMSWPTTSNNPAAARIRYAVGYDLPGNSPNPNPIPESVVAAIKLVLGHLYENREETISGNRSSLAITEIPIGAKVLLDLYRVRQGFA